MFGEYIIIGGGSLGGSVDAALGAISNVFNAPGNGVIGLLLELPPLPTDLLRPPRR